MVPSYAKFLAKCYVYLAIVLSLFRLVAFFILNNAFKEMPATDILYAFFMGWRFDNVIVCGMLTIPFLIFTFNHFTFKTKALEKLAKGLLLLLTVVIIFLQMLDLSYFEFFSIRITSVVLNWLSDMMFAIKMVKDEPEWLLVSIIAPIIIFLSILPIKYWGKKLKPSLMSIKQNSIWALVSFGILIFLFLGIRGRVALKSPIREGTAFFSSSSVLNNLALNPNYTFFSSLNRALKYKDKPLKLISNNEALKEVEALYEYEPSPGHNPLTRVIHSGELKDLNLVFVIMEGMTNHYPREWTPHLNRLKNEGIYFSKTFSAGMHTYNGIWSTLFSFPSPYTLHPLKRDVIPSLNSFAKQFVEKNRETYFFTTHDDQFDNMAGFLRQNGFKHITGQSKYPEERILSILGVPDFDMFKYAFNKFEEVDSHGRFFAAFMTGSNHRPYVIPPELKETFNSKNMQENVVRYSDWSIGEMTKLAMQKDWGKRTIFVFVADHGTTISHGSSDTEIMEKHHVPFIIWSPMNITPKLIETPVMQVDVFPTVLNFMGGEWFNSTLGKNIIDHPRNFVYVGRDESTCLVQRNFIECERSDKSRNKLPLEKAFWASNISLEDEENTSDEWSEIHSELQLSDNVLRTRQHFP